MGEGDCWNSIVKGTLERVYPKMLGRASTFPPSSDRQPQTPRASFEHEARSEPPRTSISDEAQACFNLLLILRNDTQYLISLRNDNLQAFEDTDARPLLSQINGAITAATRSIYELGPFLERHRWPPSEPPRASIIRLKNLRKRSRSLSSPTSGIAAATGPVLSPDELFSWTVALTAQHSTVLSALDQLERFLVCGSADITEDERRKHDATGSWWQQQHSEFENVTLIQSMLRRPRRNLRGGPCASVATPAVDRAECAQIGVAVTAPTAAVLLPFFHDHEDGKSETLTFSEQSVGSWPGEMVNGGLTARPRALNEGSPRGHSHLTYKPLDLRIMGPGPTAYPQTNQPAAVQTEQYPGPTRHHASWQEREVQKDAHESEDQSLYGRGLPELPLSRFNSSARRPRITTTLLPPLVGLQALIPEISQRARSATLEPTTSAHAVSPLSPYSPLLSPPGLSRRSSQVSLLSPVQLSPTVDTPFTPLNQQVATMFEQKSLPSKTIQPVIHELDNMIASPVDSMQPVFELGVSPVGHSNYNQSPLTQEDEKHWPYLAYMARKQAVTMSRWSVRHSKSTKSKASSDG